jgi:hypothetical protein
VSPVAGAGGDLSDPRRLTDEEATDVRVAKEEVGPYRVGPGPIRPPYHLSSSPSTARLKSDIPEKTGLLLLVMIDGYHFVTC